MDRLRVLQVVPKLVAGGGQRVAMDLVEHLDHQWFDVQIVSLYPFSNEIFEVYFRDLGVTTHYLTKHRGLDIEILLEIHQIFRRFKPHVVHNHLHALYAILPSSLVNKVPVQVHTVHSMANQEAKGLHRFISHIAFHKLGVLPVSISQTVRQSVLDIYGEVDSQVIYNGIDTQKYAFSEVQRKKWREQYDIAENTFVFVNVASFSSIKNQRLLVYAFKDALQYYPSSLLVLVGDGETRQEIAGLVKELGLLNKVLLTGIKHEVAQILSGSDCFVLSSTWEGLPISVLEAMAGSKPIIATNVGGLSELIIHCENGFLVPPGNCQQLGSAMLALCNDRSRAITMGKRSRQIVEQRFDVREMAKQYGELYLKGIEGTVPHLN